MVHFALDSTRNFQNQYFMIACPALFYYDFILTIPQEIKYLWCSKPKLMTVLVLALRYITAFDFALVLMLTFMPWKSGDADIHCRVLAKIPGIIGVVCQCVIISFLTIRLFAIYDRSRWILCLTMPLGALVIVLSSLTIKTSGEVLETTASEFIGPTQQERYLVVSSTSCYASPISYVIATGGSVIVAKTRSMTFYFYTSIAAICFDTSVFFLALAKLRSLYHAKQWFAEHTPVTLILHRDGTFLFAIMAICNLVPFILFMHYFFEADLSHGSAWQSFMFILSSGANNEMLHATSAVLVTRMVFNLRAAGTEILEGTMEWQSRVERQVATMRFRAPMTVQEESDDLIQEDTEF